MVFSSVLFIFGFLPITLLFYFVAYKFGKIRIANLTLLLSSMVFYAWGGVKPFLILLFLIIINYFLMLLMRLHNKLQKLFFLAILIIDIGNLFYFKYFDFFIDNLKLIPCISHNNLLEISGSIIMPIGISFYTFKLISFAADFYLKRIELPNNPLDFALYMLMFPQLMSGPIERYSNISNEINNRKLSFYEFEEGVKRFILGFAKKVFIANTLGGMADVLFNNGSVWKINIIYAWIGAVCYTLQIYFDFSSYSDMAIGLGRMLGFHYAENFNMPYIAQSIQEFWRRWHISLSSWFRDYVYIPLGGNRKGTLRTYFNLAVVFLLTGFWHGAAWQFIIWGIYHGFFSIIERMGLGKALKKIPVVFRRIYTMLVVTVGWVFFRADNIQAALCYLKNMFSFDLLGIKNIAFVSECSSLFIICLIIALLFSTLKLDKLKNLFQNNKWISRITCLVLWSFSVLYLTGLSYNPFIYFKF